MVSQISNCSPSFGDEDGPGIQFLFCPDQAVKSLCNRWHPQDIPNVHVHDVVPRYIDPSAECMHHPVHKQTLRRLKVSCMIDRSFAGSVYEGICANVPELAEKEGMGEWENEENYAGF